MFSLFVCVTQDGWVEIFNEFSEEDNDALYYGGAIYFFCAIMVGAFIFANLVVAVVVTNLEIAMKELKAEKEAEVDTLAPTIDPDPEGQHVAIGKLSAIDTIYILRVHPLSPSTE